MLKVIFILTFLFTAFILCQNKNSTSFNYDHDCPTWLKMKIDSLTNNLDNAGTEVYRYDWNERFVYHIHIPINSCVFCLLFDQNGNKIQFASNDMISNFEKNRKSKMLIWERKMNQEN